MYFESGKTRDKFSVSPLIEARLPRCRGQIVSMTLSVVWCVSINWFKS